MRGGFPLLSSAVAVALAVAAGAWPSIRTVAYGGPDAAEVTAAAKIPDQVWATPAKGSYTPPAGSTDGLPPVVTKIETQEKVVFLTIDDGYEYDEEFVRIVREQKVPILTFLTSSYIAGHGPYFWALKNAGSQMENHSVSHANLPALGPEGQKKEVCGASDAIEQQYGRRPTIFRPPFGAYNDITKQVVKDCGMKSIILWSAEYYNGTTSPQGVRDAFVRGDGGTGFKPGDIVLMHYRKGLAQQMTTILGWINEQGYKPAALENYLPESLGGNAPG
ncbi:polysaccharide deacetylase family protein [Actinocorallia sp. A-T 12471]|uniref:polysaccharide deacetylase family protein n=1 Tax=Actinocorallia sp. A-T 12471 TaxID=3089813 RepID=UPI0029CD4BD3|nr:polysaccharide deacetylase family protein [Actinocorallia sp. A-T 12471]MDX6743110.1 polysaccharide deacetylase family protein [Actinocorallia sp. A-T 12471]